MIHLRTLWTLKAPRGRIPAGVLHIPLIARAFAGYSLGEADIVRKAMGKKIPEVMRKEREKFIAGAVRQGFEKSLADRVVFIGCAKSGGG